MEIQTQLLASIAASLEAIATNMAGGDGLGFQASAGATVVYCNAGEGGGGWYTLTPPPERQQVTQPPSIKGFIRDIKFLTPEGRKYDNEKCRIHLDCGKAGLYILEAGADTGFTKCLLSSLAAVENAADLRSPVNIFTWVTDRDALMAALTLANGEKPRQPWDRDTDFTAIREAAIAKVYAASQRHLVETPAATPKGATTEKRWGVTYSPGPMQSKPAPVAAGLDDIPF